MNNIYSLNSFVKPFLGRFISLTSQNIIPTYKKISHHIPNTNIEQIASSEKILALVNAFCGQNINPLASNDVYVSRTAQLTPRRCILSIYSTNILTEYFKHAAPSPFFFLQDAVYFIMLTFFVPLIFTFQMQVC